MTPRRFLIIGNPDNRRVVLYVEALKKLGAPSPIVVSHSSLLDGSFDLSAVDEDELWVRIDSAGENDAVAAKLLELGADAAEAAGVSSMSKEALSNRVIRKGEIVCPTQQHLGFCRYLDELDAAFARRPGWTVLSPISTIKEVFDKRRTHAKYSERGLPVPEALGAVTSPEMLRERMRQEGWRNVFVKLASGSSASCLAAYNFEGRGQGILMTTIERTDDGWYNSLKVKRVSRPEGVDQVLSFLIGEGCHIERAIPKARLERSYMDCRVVVIDGEPAFTVVRQNNHPITNLHLGGWRGDLALLEATAPKEELDAMRQSAVDAWKCHDAFCLGIDVMLERGFRGHRVLEANAFGDLLPGLKKDGLSVYEWQIQRLAER